MLQYVLSDGAGPFRNLGSESSQCGQKRPVEYSMATVPFSLKPDAQFRGQPAAPDPKQSLPPSEYLCRIDIHRVGNETCPPCPAVDR
jgi:hypothetical protein